MDDKVLDELQKMNATISALEAAQDEDEDAAGAQHAEAEAKAHEDEGARHMAAAQRASADSDDEEARREDEAAAACFTKAVQAHLKASAHHTAMAARCRESADEEAATAAEAAATRFTAAAEQAKGLAASATQRAEAASRKDEDARKENADEDAMAQMFAMFMRNARQTEDAAHDPTSRKAALFKEDDEMAAAFYAGIQAAMKGMTFHPGMARRKSAEAAHDDEDEDKALIQRMLRQKGMKASATPVPDMQTKRTLRRLEASLELLTDNVTKMMGLLTDKTQPRGLATDTTSSAPNGGQGPQRRSMAGASGELWVDKYAAVRYGAKNGMKSPADYTAELVAQGITDPTKQMAAIIDAQQRGECALQ